jgi:Flp pilus assembly protein TadD
MGSRIGLAVGVFYGWVFVVALLNALFEQAHGVTGDIPTLDLCLSLFYGTALFFIIMCRPTHSGLRGRVREKRAVLIGYLLLAVGLTWITMAGIRQSWRTSGRSFIKESAPSVAQQQTPQVAKTKVQASSVQASVTATGAGQKVAISSPVTAASRRSPEPATVESTALARQAEVRRHTARGMEFWRNTRYGDAEAEYRAAIRLDPLNGDLHGALTPCLSDEGRNDEAVAEGREALRLAPTSEPAHYGLGYALMAKRDFQGAEPELREALRLSPGDDNGMSHLRMC